MSPAIEAKRYPVRSCRGFSTDLPWETAEILTAFNFPWEPEREPPRTEFRALWDEEQLFFRFECADDDLVLGTGANAMEKVIGSDRVEIFFAPDLDLNPYYCLEMDPRGEVLDYEARFHRRMNWDWQCPGLRVDAEQSESGYAVEGSLPLETLRQLHILKPNADTFFAGVFRAEFSQEADSVREGWMAWVNPETPEPDFHVPSSFGRFELAE